MISNKKLRVLIDEIKSHIDLRIDALDVEVNTLNSKLDDIYVRFLGVEKNTVEVGKQLKTIERKVVNSSEQLEKIESKMSDFSPINYGLDDIKAEINSLHIKVDDVFERVSKSEEISDLQNTRMDELEQKSVLIDAKITEVCNSNFRNSQNILDAKILQAQSLIANQKDFATAGFKVFSQWDDDGLIQYLIKTIDISNKIFIEFGVEDYTESNTRFLLMNNNWNGLVFDGSKEYVDYIKKDDIYWKHNLKAECAFITAENINELISKNGIKGEIGLLHIDIDGVDYWVWKAIDVVTPDIVIMEFNSVLGKDRAITVPYKSDFCRLNAHHSGIYAGASLRAMCMLAEEKGYSFIGVNSAANNAYFVKKSKLGDLKALSVDEGYKESQFRESRNKDGSLTFASGEDRLKLIKGLPIINVETGKEEKI